MPNMPMTMDKIQLFSKRSAGVIADFAGSASTIGSTRSFGSTVTVSSFFGIIKRFNNGTIMTNAATIIKL